MTALALTRSEQVAPVQEQPSLALTSAHQRWLPMTRVLELLSENEGTIRRRCQNEWSGKGLARKMRHAETGRTMWHVDVTADHRLSRSHVIGNVTPQKSSAALLLDLPEKHRELAIKRASALMRFRVWRVRAGVHTLKDYPTFAESIKSALGIEVSRRQMYEWHATAPSGDDMSSIACALIDRRGSLAGSRISDDAWAFFQSLYLTGNQWSIAKCYRTLLSQAQGRGWAVPSQRRMEQLVKERISPSTIALHREGVSSWSSKYQAPMQQLADAYAAGEMWESDHMRFDFFCQTVAGGRLVGRRPWLTTWLDRRTRRVMGFVVSMTPCGDTIREALLRAIKASPVGPPKRVWLDNGKDFKQAAHTGLTRREMREVAARGGYWLDEVTTYGLFPMLGIEPHFAEPYNHNGKARIERFHRTVHQDFDREFEAWCGSKPGQRDADELAIVTADARHFPTIEDVRERFAEWAAAYNHRSDHSMEDLADEATGELLSPEAFMLRKADEKRCLPDPAALALLEPRWSRPLKVTKRGISVRLDGDITRRYGDVTPELERFKGSGELVYITFDKEDTRRVRVYDSRLQFVCLAPINAEYGGVNRNAISVAAWKAGRAARRRQKQIAEQRHDPVALLLPDAELAVREHRRQVVADERARINAGALADPVPLKITRTALDGQAAKVERAERNLLAEPEIIDADASFDISAYERDVDDADDHAEEFSIADTAIDLGRDTPDEDAPFDLSLARDADDEAHDGPDVLERLQQ